MCDVANGFGFVSEYGTCGSIRICEVDALSAVITTSNAAERDQGEGIGEWHKIIMQMINDSVNGKKKSDKYLQLSSRTCSMAKQTKARSTGTLLNQRTDHVIHTDIYRPIKPLTLGQSHNFMSIIVERSQFSKVFVIKNRSEALQKFEKFEACLERETGVLVKWVHLDNAMEYVGMNKFLDEQGSVHTHSAKYTPQSNGCAERYKRTVLDKLRSMLKDSGLTI